MSIVKIKNKKGLEQLQAKLTLRLGRKPTQQETLDYCLILANQKFEEIIQIAMNLPILNLTKAQKIIEERNNLDNIPYNTDLHFDSKNDEDIYNL